MIKEYIEMEEDFDAETFSASEDSEDEEYLNLDSQMGQTYSRRRGDSR